MLSRTTAAPLPGFDAIDFAGDGPVIAAVSGGSDSLALLFLLKSHLDRTGSAKPLIAVTVDHGLRPESAREAERTGALCTAHGIAHRTLTWTGPKPESGIQQAARAARYGLLTAFAGEVGADFVVTGHTLDDQRETVLMRSRRGRGPGLSGIAPATFARSGDRGAWFLRPLLKSRRADLRKHLEATGIDWIDDPSNRRDDFERVRARKELAGLKPDDPLPARLDALCREAAMARLALGRRTADLLDRHVREATPGLFLLPDALLADGDREAVANALRIIAAFAGGNAHLPPYERAARLAERLATGERFRATMARALVDRRNGGAWILREGRHVGRADGAGIFDNRFAAGKGEPLRLPDAADVAVLAQGHADPGAPASLVRAALSRQPAGVGTCRRLLNPWAQLVPVFDLEPANALARIAGTGDIVAPPYKGPIERLP